MAVDLVDHADGTAHEAPLISRGGDGTPDGTGSTWMDQNADQVLQELGGGWFLCQDEEGVFYLNSVSGEWTESPPVVASGD